MILIGLLTVIASFIGTISGFGTSLVMIPILSLHYPLPQVLLFVGIIHFISDIWKILLFKNSINKKLIFTFGISGLFTGLISANFVSIIPEIILTRILSIVLIFFVLLFFIKPNFKFPDKGWVTVLAGTVDGFLAGITGVGGPVRGAFLSAFKLPKSVYISTAGAIGMMIDSARITTYIASGIQLPTLFSWGLIVCIPLSLLGAKLAQRALGYIPEERFRYLVGSILLVVATVLLLRSSFIV